VFVAGIPVVHAQSIQATRLPVIEERAPGAFDRRAPTLRDEAVRYQVDATVLMPLLFASIPVAHREDVGVASFIVRDLSGPSCRPRLPTTRWALRACRWSSSSNREAFSGWRLRAFLRRTAGTSS
jgi:hypothetical protein